MDGYKKSRARSECAFIRIGRTGDLPVNPATEEER
jgi:hypothetical protein